MSDNPNTSSTNRATPQTYKPKTIEIYLTNPPLSPLQTPSQVSKWNHFFHILTADPRWIAATSYPCPALPTNTLKFERVPYISLTPSTPQRYDNRAEAREQEEKALNIFLQLGFIDVSGTWNPKILLQWRGFPDHEWVGKNMNVRKQWLESGGYEKRFWGHGNGGEIPDREWVEFVKRFGGFRVKMTGKRREEWVVSRL